MTDLSLHRLGSDVPAEQRIAELEAARDSLTTQLRRHQAEQVVCHIGSAVLRGSRENVEKAKWTLAHLKAKAIPGARTFTLADAFDTTDRLGPDPSAPLPLGYHEAVTRAVQLREKGSEWTWPAIATLMAEYHGFRRGPEWWRKEARARGATPRPRGAAFGQEAA